MNLYGLLGHGKVRISEKSIIKIIGLLVVFYGIALMGIYTFQSALIFQGKTLHKAHRFDFDQPFEELAIATHDGLTLNALLFKTKLPSRGLVLYFHGNGDNLQRWGNYAVDFTNLGFDILMVDYRGYGKSEGTPSEEFFYRDAVAIHRWATAHLRFERLILYGRSLGSAVASYLATQVKADLLILETPFAEIKDAFYWLLRPIFYIFPIHATFSNLVFMQKATCPKAIFHGTRDWVVPLASAERLKPMLNRYDRFVVIKGAGHRNLRHFKAYHEALAQVLGAY